VIVIPPASRVPLITSGLCSITVSDVVD
jgi:hypothetical protein